MPSALLIGTGIGIIAIVAVGADIVDAIRTRFRFPKVWLDAEQREDLRIRLDAAFQEHRHFWSKLTPVNRERFFEFTARKHCLAVLNAHGYRATTLDDALLEQAMKVAMDVLSLIPEYQSTADVELTLLPAKEKV